VTADFKASEMYLLTHLLLLIVVDVLATGKREAVDGF